jgi:hypothetical protein
MIRAAIIHSVIVVPAGLRARAVPLTYVPFFCHKGWGRGSFQPGYLLG